MKGVRISIYVPQDHPLAQKEVKERAPYARELIDFALNYKDAFNEVNERTLHIERLLEKGAISQNSVNPDAIIDETTDKALNDTLFGMLNSFGVSSKKN